MSSQIKRKAGIALVTIALALVIPLLGGLLWSLGLTFEQDANRSFFWQKEFYYLLPVFLFLLPAIYLVHIGRKLMREESLSLVSFIEVILMLGIGIALIYFNLSAGSYYSDPDIQMQPGCELYLQSESPHETLASSSDSFDHIISNEFIGSHLVFPAVQPIDSKLNQMDHPSC